MKKILALIITAAIMCSIPGCGNKNEDKTNAGKGAEKLRVFFMDAKTPDVDLVSEKLSEITREKLGVNIEMVMFDTDYATKLPMLIATDEQMDICWTNSDGFEERARKGAYADITDLLKNTPKLYNLFDKDFWKGVSYNDRIYAVPTLKEMAEQWVCYAETDFLEANNIKIDENRTYSLKELETILAVLKNNPDRPGFEIGAKGQHDPMDILNHFDVITGSIVVNKETDKVENYYMSKEFEAYVKLMREWYDKGYIASDVATRNGYGQYKSGHKGITYAGYAPYNELLSKRYNNDIAVTPIKMTPAVISNTSTCGSAFAILEKCKDKEKAMKFLELWNTDSKVKNLITYGIEGKHYTLENGKVKQADDYLKHYLNQNWASGNEFIATLLVNEPDDKFEKYAEFNKSAEKSRVLGFKPDVTNINDKMLACSGAAAEFTGLLSCGAVEPDEYLPKLKKALESAGVNDVVKELQKQYDEWKNR